MKPTRGCKPTMNRRREHFPTLRAGIHLLSHSLGPVPRAARGAMAAYLDQWQKHVSEDAWASSWWDLSREAGDRVGGLIGADRGTVEIQPNASVAMSVVASCFDFTGRAKRKVVTSALDFPSMGYL